MSIELTACELDELRHKQHVADAVKRDLRNWVEPLDIEPSLDRKRYCHTVFVSHHNQERYNEAILNNLPKYPFNPR